MKSILLIEEKGNRKQYITEFDKIAKKLLNKFILKTPCEKYLIREIEFFYLSENHNDYYCHRNDRYNRQLFNSKLYFHRFNLAERYLLQRRKGIDITIGNNSNTRGGILIRTIQNIKTNEVTSGIGRIANKIIDEIGGAKIIYTIYKKDYEIFNENSIVQLLETPKSKMLKIYKKQRVGLNFKEEDYDNFFHSAKYNYFTFPEIIKLI